MRLNSKQILQFTGGTYLIEPIDSSRILCGMTWDSRDVEDGCLFVALPGENVDGHDFVVAALNSGAGCVLVNEAPESKACLLAQELGAGIIEVPNTYHAIEDLALNWRDFLNATVVAITGSVGKTTTKNLTRDVCSSRFKTVATKANQNNELGVPNTILSADPDTQVIVVEMGMRGAGQIAHLCSIAKPDWGVITNVGECHMELLGSFEAIVNAKAELLCALPDGSGKAILNAENDASLKMIQDENLLQRRVSLEWFGSKEAVEAQLEDDENKSFPYNYGNCWYEDLALDGEGRATFTLCARGFKPEDAKEVNPTLFNMEPDVLRCECTLSVRGAHNALNACSAACVGLSLGMSLEEVVEALSASVPETGRLETVVGRDGFLVINDAYNANPDSMRAALHMLSSMNVQGKRIAVLGDMGELGAVELECHRGIGREAANVGIDKLICVGELSAHMAASARESGLSEDAVCHVDSIASALELLEGALAPEDVILVKASHFMRLDRIVDGLVS